jgi:hypothetical protein
VLLSGIQLLRTRHFFHDKIRAFYRQDYFIICSKFD